MKEKTHLIPHRQLFLPKLHAPANALRHAEPLVVQLAGELEADAAEPGAARGVDAERGGELADDGAKVARLETGGAGLGAAREGIMVSIW